MINTQYINLNMTPSGVMPVLYVSQYDIGRPLGMVVYNGGEAVDLDTYTCTIEATRTDGTPITAAVTTDDNIGVFVTTATMTNQADKYLAKLVLFDSNSHRVASLAFVMCVTPKTMDENAESIEEDRSLYQQYTGTVQSLIADIRTQLNAETAARQAGDQTLTQNLAAEASARQAADTSLQSALSAETSARQSADQTLTANLASEVSARQTADSNLQSAIASEASTRSTQDASLQSQINQLVAPSGEAPSAAEVQNARIGADGVTYDTLGNAIRGQVSDIKNALVHPNLTWHVGGYISSSGNIVTTDGQAARSAYTDFITVQPGDLIDGSVMPVKDSSDRTLSCNIAYYHNKTFVNRKNAQNNNGKNIISNDITEIRFSLVINDTNMTTGIIDTYFNIGFYLKPATYEEWLGTNNSLYANRDESKNSLRVFTYYDDSGLTSITNMPRFSYIYGQGSDLQSLLDNFSDKLLTSVYYVIECTSLSLTGNILMYHVYAVDYSKEWWGYKRGDNDIDWHECDANNNAISYPTITWDIGKYISGTGAIVDDDGYAARSAISNLIPVQPGDIIDYSNLPIKDENDNSYTYWLNLYKNGVWYSRLDFNPRIKIIPAEINGIRFSFNIQNIPMTNAIIASAFKTKFYLKPASYEELVNVKNAVYDAKINEFLKQVAVFSELGWVYGYLGSTANSGIGYTNKNTIVCPQYIFAEKGTVFSASNDYRFSVRVYNNPDNSAPIAISDLDTTSYTMNQDGFVRLTVAKPSNSESLEITDMYDAVAHIMTNVPTYILNPIIYKDVFPPEIITRTQEVFVQAMNEKAAQIGMTNSIFADTYGENTAISRVTARDMVRMGVEACSYNELCRVWQTNEKTITTFDSARREIFCQYGNEGERTNLETLEESYPVLGKKNGYMPLSGSNKIFTMVAVCVVDGKIVVGSLGILGTMSADDGRAQRPVAMKELMDNVKAIMDGGNASTPTYYNYGCAAELPVGNPAMYERKDLNWLYEYNPDTQFAPASCTKVMTAMVMLDYVTDIHAKFKVLNAPSGGLLKGTDILSYEQALYLMMLPSNGTACYAVARAVGTQMITAYS